MSMMPSWLNRHLRNPAILSHAIYRMTKREPWAMLDSNMLEHILNYNKLPTPREQLVNLILWLGETQPSPGAMLDDTAPAVSAIGAVDLEGLAFVVSQALHHGYVNAQVADTFVGAPPNVHSLQLTIDGWDYLEQIQREQVSSSIAFMAMRFGDEEADKIYREHFKPAVKETGFDLRRIDEGQPAGLIDDRLRVEIRQSRFLIADLTHHNNGAYWEAGFAEGLGKPVIYTCRRDVFEDRAKGTHFDTNHHLTVIWEADKLDEAVRKLKDTIRATLPGDAKLMD